MNDTIQLTREDLERLLDEFGEDINRNSLSGTGRSVWDGVNLTEWVDKRWPKTPDPKDCIYADRGLCLFASWQRDMGGTETSPPCVGLDNCRKAEMLLGVGSELPQKI